MLVNMNMMAIHLYLDIAKMVRMVKDGRDHDIHHEYVAKQGLIENGHDIIEMRGDKRGSYVVESNI